MRIEIQLRIMADDNSVISEGEILHLDKGDDRLDPFWNIVYGWNFQYSYLREKPALTSPAPGGMTGHRAAGQANLRRRGGGDMAYSEVFTEGTGQEAGLVVLTASSATSYCPPAPSIRGMLTRSASWPPRLL